MRPVRVTACDRAARPRDPLVPRRRGVPVRDRSAGCAHTPQPVDRPALAGDHAQRRQPRPDRLLAQPRRRRRPDLRARRDGGRSFGGRHRPGPGRGAQPQAHHARRRPAQHPARLMIWGAWICLLSRRVAACGITLGVTRLARRTAGYLATASCFVAFGGALASFIGLLGRDGSQREIISTAWTWITGGSYQSGLQVLIDPLSVFMMLIVSGVGALIVWYSIGYMD